MHFKQATPRYSNLNPSSHPFHSFERKQPCSHCFLDMHGWIFSQDRSIRGGSSPHERLSRAAHSGGCTSNRRRHHGHKPESSCQLLGKSGFCMTAYGHLGELSMSLAQALTSPEPAWEWRTNHYHLSLFGPRCPPCVTTNLYDLHWTFGWIINTLRPRQDGRHFPGDILKWIAQ